MSKSSLTITFEPSTAWGTGKDWLRLEQVNRDSDMATVADAARVIDATFGIDTCEEGLGNGGDAVEYDEEGQVVPPVGEGEFLDIAQETVPLNACLAMVDYSWVAYVDVIRSRNDIPYKLQIENGSFLETQLIGGERTVSMILDGVSEMDLPYPPLGPVTGTWGNVTSVSGALPEWRVGGATLYLSEPARGQLNLTYATAWDRVSIKVHGPVAGVQSEPLKTDIIKSEVEIDTEGNPPVSDDGLQNGEVICFWNRLAEPLTLEPPETDTTADGDADLCSRNRQGDTEEEELPTTCYELVTHEVKCQCSGKVVSSEEVEVAVDCPEGTLPGAHLVGSRRVTSDYIDCDEAGWEVLGGVLYRINDPAYYEEVCCFPPPSGRSLPPCPVIKRVWKPGAEVKPSKAYWQDKLGPDVEFVAVAPREGNCGELTIRWEVNNNCCASAPPVEWDYTNSADVMADNSMGAVFWIGGLGPFDVQISGTGFWLDAAHTKKTLTTNSPFVLIYTSAACGVGEITVRDYCLQVASGAVRSVNGQWVIVEDLANTHTSCASVSYGNWGSTCYSESIRGAYKVQRADLLCLSTCGGVQEPVRLACPAFGIRTDPCLTNYGVATMAEARPILGHDPGPCDPEPDCRSEFITGQMSYCNHEVIYPGVTWRVWAWQC